MANKIVDVTLRLKDQISGPFKDVSKKLQDAGQNMQRMGRNIQRTGKSIQSVGSSMTKHLTVPIVGAGVAATKLAADFQQGMADVAAISGATGKDLEDLTSKAKSMDKLGFAATEVTDAYKYMGMAGWNAQQMMSGVEPIMKLAAATNTELGATSDIVTDALTAFGAKAEDTARLADILATAATSSNTDILKMGETFKYVAPVAGAMNFSMEETSAVAGLMANAGIKASSAGTALRSVFTNLSAPTKAAGDAMEKLGITSSEMANMPVKAQMDKLRESFKGLSKDEAVATAKAIAGKTGMSGLLAIINAGEEDYNNLTSAIQNSSHATDDMFNKTMETTTGKLKQLKASLQNLGVSFGEILLPVVTKVVDKVQNAVNWFKNLSEEQKKTIVKIAGIAAAAGPAIMIFGKMTSGIGGVILKAGKLGAAMKKAGGFLNLLKMPSSLVVGSLAAVAAVVFLVIKNWDRLKPAFTKVWNAIKPIFDSFKKAFGAAGGAASGFSNIINDVFVDVMTLIADVLADIIGGIVPIIQELIPVFTDVFKIIGDVVQDIAKILPPVFKEITKVIKNLMPVIQSLVKTAFGALLTAVKALVPIIRKLVPIIGTALKSAFKVLSTVLKAVAPVITKIVNLIGKALTNTIKKLAPIITKLGNLFAKIFNKISGVITKVINKITPVIEKLQPVFEGVLDAVGTAFEVALGVVTSVIDTLIDNFEGVFDAVTNIFSGIIDFIDGVFSGNWEQVWNSIVQVFKGIWDGLVAIAKAPINLVIGAINGLIGGLNKIKLPDWVPGIGGKGINIPLIPKLAKGTEAWRGGLVQISERGGEIVDLPKGSRVYPHDKSVQQAYKDGKASGGTGKVCITIPKLADQIVVRQDSDIDAIATKLADKLEKVALNVGGSGLGYQYQSI